MDFEGLAKKLSATARGCGEIILEVYDSDFAVEEKADASPVTIADQRSEAHILPDLRQLTPDIPIVAEEDVAANGAPSFEGTTFWLVDALDGTKEFIKRRGSFTVNLGLILDGVPAFGLIYAPVQDALWVGWGDTAYKSESGSPLSPISARVQKTPPVILGSKSHAVKDQMDAFLERHPDAEFKAYGSSLKFCAVAEGAADLYPRFGPTSEWDTAAGHAIVLAAGGSVNRFEGERLDYKKPNFLNGPFLVQGKG